MSSGRRLSGKLTYANVMATLAVFIALGGTGYAVSKLPKDSVKSKQIATDAVKGPEVAANAIGAAEVIDGSLQSGDFAAGQLPQGPQGPQGQQGQQGVAGPTYGDIGRIASGTPAATPDAFTTSKTLTTPTAGKLMVFYSVSANRLGGGMGVDCSSGDGEIALYVDSVRVPGTQILVADNVGIPATLIGITDLLPAGSHNVQVGSNCPSGNVVSGITTQTNALGGILLGS